MPNHPDLTQHDVSNDAESPREILDRSMEVLRRPTADTFLGRKTHEPFPSEDDPMDRPDIQQLIHSELQPPE